MAVDVVVALVAVDVPVIGIAILPKQKQMVKNMFDLTKTIKEERKNWSSENHTINNLLTICRNR